MLHAWHDPVPVVYGLWHRRLPPRVRKCPSPLTSSTTTSAWWSSCSTYSISRPDGDCNGLINKATMVLAHVHVCFQPLVVNMWTFSMDDNKDKVCMIAKLGWLLLPECWYYFFPMSACWLIPRPGPVFTQWVPANIQSSTTPLLARRLP